MSLPRVAFVSDKCQTGDECYRLAKLEDDTYVLILGDVRVIARQPLPMDPGEGSEFYPSADLQTLSNEWQSCIESIENSGDETSAQIMHAFWERTVEAL
jgi:hypothetical protein